jgi:hypothetical protein
MDQKTDCRRTQRPPLKNSEFGSGCCLVGSMKGLTICTPGVLNSLLWGLRNPGTPSASERGHDFLRASANSSCRWHKRIRLGDKHAWQRSFGSSWVSIFLRGRCPPIGLPNRRDEATGGPLRRTGGRLFALVCGGPHKQIAGKPHRSAKSILTHVRHRQANHDPTRV